jgi:predicted transcriptional regulator
MSKITVELDDDQLRMLEKVAEASGRALAAIVSEAVDVYGGLIASEEPPLSEADMDAIRDGLAQIARGETYSHADVMAQIRARFGE